ncbi:efflux RND transporter permease subunit [Candidatus Thioglobus autotrophicus]|uniref:efflux RND transporter permease subunit n=1 Tax=Candidatus Thioglobus autotrophicus TaxID=1705394 RepID=UPI00299E8483|nr:efflux RND transporter permease subunit [Candidatus Thioglobus autotrophicus]WPE17512.1 efflux RND transporter permease subunit [Candidatus Thioglobus autotrophicus]
MNGFLDFLVRQKKLALVFSISVIALGLVSLNNIQRDQFPDVDFEIMTIVTSYPGASPEDVEQNITNVIEDELSSVTGIDKFTSTSRAGVSSIVITFSQDVSDLSEIKQEVRNVVNRIKSLPEEVVDLPRVIDRKTSRKSIIKISLSSDEIDYAELRGMVDSIAQSIESIEGVSEVTKDGYLDKEIQIHIDPEKLYQYELSLPQVMSAITQRNQRYTVGSNHNDKNEKTIVVLSKFDAATDVSEVIVKSTFEGLIVRLKDIAVIESGNVEEKSIVRVNGKKGFILRVKKQAQADVITTVDLVKAYMEKTGGKYNNQLDIFYSSDLSKYVRNRLDIVTNNGLIGLLLVLVVLGAFLSFKTAFWVAISLPVSLLGTVALLGATGETINLISLAAMILVLGIVVDDSIIVAESIYHYKQTGEDNFKSASHGFKRVIMPVVTTILTTILAFSSMFLMGGMMGKFIYVIPLVIIFALTLSFLEVSLALPAHLAGSNEKKKKHNWFEYFEIKFEVLLSKILNFHYLVIGIFSITLVISIYFASTQMKFTLFPAVGVDTINTRMTMNTGSSLSNTEAKAKQVEELIYRVVGDDLVSVTTDVGKYFTHKAKMTIELLPASERDKNSKEILKSLKASANEIDQVEKLKFSVRRPGPPQGEDVEINLISQAGSENLQAANKLEQILLNIPGVDNVNRDDEPGKDRIEVKLDFEKMARLDIDFSTVNRYLRAAFTGIDVTNIREGQNDVNFRLYLGDLEKSEVFIKSLKVVNKNGRVIPLVNFSSIRQIVGEPDFNHYNGLRSIMLSASVNDEKTSTSEVMKEALLQLDLDKNFPSVRAISEGGAKETAKSMDSFKQAFLMAIVGIFLLLVLLFNSYSQPLIILSAIPFSVIGVIWAFFLHSEALSFFAILGILALVGVIVNDSLVLVSHLNYLKEKALDKMSVHQWIIKGTKDRLRAVVLTSLTTLAGILPLAYGLGGTDFLLQPMALALGYGLLFGTLMTLILLPCLYLMNVEFITWFKKLKKKRISS